MKLSDWPLSEECNGEQVCGYRVPHTTYPGRMLDLTGGLYQLVGEFPPDGVLTRLIEIERCEPSRDLHSTPHAGCILR